MALPQGKVTNDPTNYFAIAQQSAKDTDGTVWYFLKHRTGTGFDVDIKAGFERVGGAGREVGLSWRQKVTADGAFVQYAQPDAVGRFAALTVFQDTVTAGPSNLGTGLQYFSTHKLFTGASIPLYFTAEQAWADETERTGNCVVSSLKFDGAAGMPVNCTVQFMSGGTPHSMAGPQTAVREAAFPLMYPGGSAAITMQGSTLGQLPVGAASSLQLTKWSVELKNQLDGDIQTNALNREDMLWLNADYEVTGTFKYINNAAWEQVKYSGGSQVSTSFLPNGNFTFYTAETGTLGGQPDLSSLQIVAPYLEFADNFKVNRLDPDGQTMYIDFVGVTKQIGSSSVQITVVSPASTSYALSTT